MQFMR